MQAGSWCNGSTGGFCSLSRGSIPRGPCSYSIMVVQRIVTPLVWVRFPVGTSYPYGPMVRMRGFHPRGQGSIPCRDVIGWCNGNIFMSVSHELGGSIPLPIAKGTMM